MNDGCTRYKSSNDVIIMIVVAIFIGVFTGLTGLIIAAIVAVVWKVHSDMENTTKVGNLYYKNSELVSMGYYDEGGPGYLGPDDGEDDDNTCGWNDECL